MSMPRMLIQDESSFGSGVKRVSLACAHGMTARLLLPGRVPLEEKVLRDLLVAVHDSETGCRCSETLRQPAAQA